MYAKHPLPMMQRSHGYARASFAMAAGKQRLLDLRQEGCAKLFMPYHRRDQSEVIFLNTAGGSTLSADASRLAHPRRRVRD